MEGIQFDSGIKYRPFVSLGALHIIFNLSIFLGGISVIEISTPWVNLDCHSFSVPITAERRTSLLASQMLSLECMDGGADSQKHHRLWVQRSPFGSNTENGNRRRLYELHRPLSSTSQSVLRTTLIVYADGEADIVIVGRRPAVTRTEMEALASNATGFNVISTAPTLGSIEDLCRLQPATALPPWGRQRREIRPTTRSTTLISEMVVPNPGEGAESTWAAALAAVLRIYDSRAGRTFGWISSSSNISNLMTFTEFDIDSLENCQVVSACSEILSSKQDFADAFRAQPSVGLLWSRANEKAAFSHNGRSSQYIAAQAPIFPLTITVDIMFEGLARLGLLYSSKHFEREAVSQFMQHFLIAQKHFEAGPNLKFRDVIILPSSEVEQNTINDSFAPAYASVPALIIAAAKRRSTQIAIRDEHGTTTWSELYEIAMIVARALGARGISHGDLVGVCMSRSRQQVIAQLSIWLLGAAYVPIDPDGPCERNRHIIEDSGVRVIIVDSDNYLLSSSAVMLASWANLCTPDNEDIDTSLPRSWAPDDPAYVIYTSGSTGRPKGVSVSHGNISALVNSTVKPYALCEHDVWTMFHSNAFDFSIWETWCCLASGGELVIVPYWTSRDPCSFWLLLKTCQVTVLSQTPSAFQQLVDYDCKQNELLNVRLVVLGGESLDSKKVLPWLDRYETTCRIVNMYGLTETTVHSTALDIGRFEALTGSRSIGFPLAGWEVVVLDRDSRLAPMGAVGEFHIGGAGLARYLHPDNIGEGKFILGSHTGSLLYRTGDAGSRGINGAFDHLGRLDRQVKVRGFRIELGEIEAALYSDQAVADAAVIAIPDRSDKMSVQLRAFVQLHYGSAADVRRTLFKKLPEYMIPPISVLDRIPLNQNGKVDSIALAAIELSTTDTHLTSGSAPDDAGILTAVSRVESDVRSEWARIFNQQVGLDDDFFDLGGNSLLAANISSALRARGWVSITVKDVFMNPTIRMLSRQISDSATKG